MSFAEDQHPVGDLRPGSEYEPFGKGARPGAAGRNLHGFDTGAGQSRIERCGELPGPVADQEPEVGDHPYLDYSEVPPRLQWLRGPCTLEAGLAEYDKRIGLLSRPDL